MLILGLIPHFENLMGSIEPIVTILSEPLENPRLANPCEMKPWKEEIPCISMDHDFKEIFCFYISSYSSKSFSHLEMKFINIVCKGYEKDLLIDFLAKSSSAFLSSSLIDILPIFSRKVFRLHL